MMVVTPPVPPPSFEPAAGPSLARPNSSASLERAQFSFPSFASPSSHSSPSSQPRPADSVLLKSSLPPTPDPSPPQKVLFPVQMVALAPPADDRPSSSRRSSNDVALSTGSTPPSNPEPTSPESRSLHSPSPVKSLGMTRSETQPSLSRSSTSRIQRDRDQNRPKTSRRSTFAAPAPTAVRMTESRSSDSRTRLRSTTGVKLARYPTLAAEYPAARSRAGLQVSTPPRGPFPTPTAEFEPELDFGGPDGLEAKLVLLGSQGVGKTSLILRLTTNSYSAIPAPASLDGSLYKRKLVHNGVPIKLQIWDTAGQERFRSMAPIYYRGAHVCILVYDISDRDSFNDVRSWLDELNGKASKDMIIYVVGAKVDLDAQRAVTFGEASRTIRSWLKPPPPPPEVEPEVDTLALPPRSLFRSASGRSRTDSTGGPSPARTRPHSMHGLASLMAAAADFADFDSPSGPSSAVPQLVSPTPAPTVHFPSDVTSSAGTSAITSPMAVVPSRRHRVSFHSTAALAQPTFGTTAETAIASTANSSSRQRHASNRFSISGVLGLTARPPDVSEAVASLNDLAEANAVTPRSLSPRPSMSPSRVRTESSPMLGMTDKRAEEWSSRGWGRGEGPSAAEALEEFGQVVRQETDRPASANRGRPRGSSLGRDHRLYGEEPKREEKTWGVDVEGVRLGEVSSLTGEGVEAMCRSISAVLVARKDKIERDRTLRRKNSVMLTDSSKDAPTNNKSRYGCC